MSRDRISGRTLARSQALQILFQAEACDRSVDDVLDGDYALDQGPLDEYAERLARGAAGLTERIDALLGRISERWSPSRMPAVDRNLLRLAIYEMIAVDEVDVSVSIDEAVELAKAYGTDESYQFVNGILGRVAQGIASGEDLLGEAAQDADEGENDDGQE